MYCGYSLEAGALLLSTYNVCFFLFFFYAEIEKNYPSVVSKYSSLIFFPLSGLIQQAIYKLVTFFLFFPENRIRHFIQIVSTLHEITCLFSSYL